MPPLTVAAGRIWSACALLLAALWGAGQRLPRTLGLWAHFAALACVGNILPFFLIGWGQEQVDSGLAGILMGIMPLATLVLAHVFVEGEGLTRRSGVGFALGFLGMVVLTGPDALLELGGGSSDLVRQLAVLAGALCYAGNAIIARHLPAMDARVASAATMVVGSVLILPLCLWIDRPWTLAPSGTGLVSVVWLGAAATALATIVYYQLIASAGPTFFSYINFLIPLVAVATGILALGEAPTWNAFLALVLVLSGLAIAQWRRD